MRALCFFIWRRRLPEWVQPTSEPSSGCVGRGLLWRILHLAVSKRPVFAAGIHEIDPYILFSNAALLVDFVGNLAVEFFLDIGRSAGDPSHLDKNEAGGVLHAEVTLLRVNNLVGRVTIDDLEFVVRRNIRDFHHRPVNRVAHDPNELVRGIFTDVASGERHELSPVEVTAFRRLQPGRRVPATEPAVVPRIWRARRSGTLPPLRTQPDCRSAGWCG